MVNNGWLESFDRKCLFIFDPLESISDESESEFCAHAEYELRNCVCWFFFESSKLISNRTKKLVWTQGKLYTFSQELFSRETLFGQKSRIRKNENSEALSKDKKNSNGTFCSNNKRSNFQFRITKVKTQNVWKKFPTTR